MGTPIDPWTVERAKRPEAKLIRVIDLERDEQRWDVLKVLPEAIDYELDGCTLIFPARADRTPAESAHLIALYDELWREQQEATNDRKAA
jgi:hypothetical protein